MNIETGQVYEGAVEIYQAEARGERLVKFSDRHLDKVKAMTLDNRKAWANQLVRRRKQRKAARKANRKRRGRR